jgi:hypothetical protein
MKQLISIFTICLLSLLSAVSLAQQPAVETNLDRTELERGETVTLRLRAVQGSDYAEPSGASFFVISISQQHWRRLRTLEAHLSHQT